MHEPINIKMPYNLTCRIPCFWGFVKCPVFWNEQSCGNQIYFHPQMTEFGNAYWDGSDRKNYSKTFCLTKLGRCLKFFHWWMETNLVSKIVFSFQNSRSWTQPERITVLSVRYHYMNCSYFTKNLERCPQWNHTAESVDTWQVIRHTLTGTSTCFGYGNITLWNLFLYLSSTIKFLYLCDNEARTSFKTNEFL